MLQRCLLDGLLALLVVVALEDGLVLAAGAGLLLLLLLHLHVGHHGALLLLLGSHVVLGYVPLLRHLLLCSSAYAASLVHSCLGGA